MQEQLYAEWQMSDAWWEKHRATDHNWQVFNQAPGVIAPKAGPVFQRPRLGQFTVRAGVASGTTPGLFGPLH